MTPASIVIPTRARLSYLAVALESIHEQAAALGAEMLVVDDAGASADAERLALRFGARYEPHPRPLSLNVARNTGVERSTGELVVFLDDDIRAAPGWLAALLAAAEDDRAEVFAGRITAALEGPAPRACGREDAPITTLDLGASDTDTRFAWGSNMAIRRRALERIGPFEVALEHGGDEQEWQERWLAGTPGARVRYVAGAHVEHRRAGADARLRSLALAAHRRGRAARRFDEWRGEAPGRARELFTLAACTGHVLRRRCPAGFVGVAHSAGRLREALGSGHTRSAAGPAVRPQADDFLSGTSGTVGGFDSLRRAGHDEAINARELISGERLRLARAARSAPSPQRVLALGIVRPEHRELAFAIERQLMSSRHHVELHTCEAGSQGKFENLNDLLRAHPPADREWLLLVDDDVVLPHGFLDRLLFLSDHFSLALAQPAHRLNSHAAWPVTRRRPGSVVRETGFVEIGPVTLLARRTFDVLLPFPDLRMGWGLDLHWSALAQRHGWRCGIVDAVSIRHRAAPAGEGYARDAAVAEARSFLAERPYLSAVQAARTLTTHSRW